MEVIDFRYLTLSDPSNSMYKWCSRCVEAPTVISRIRELLHVKHPSVHNTGAGYGEFLNKIQLLFMSELEVEFKNVIHSDILPTKEYNVKQFNICADTNNMPFQFVVNVSVLEHLSDTDKIRALDNLYYHVGTGGYLIVTFDVPTCNLALIEQWVKRNIDPKPINALNGQNSPYQQEQYAHLNFVLLTVKKTLDFNNLYTGM